MFAAVTIALVKAPPGPGYFSKKFYWLVLVLVSVFFAQFIDRIKSIATAFEPVERPKQLCVIPKDN